MLGDAALLDAGLEVCAQGPVADDLGAHVVAVLAQGRDGVDQLVEALLLHQAAHAQQSHRSLPRGSRSAVQVTAVVGEALELQAVAHQVQAGGVGGAEAAAQVAQVVVADGDRVVGACQLAAQVLGVHVLVEDVLGVGSEGVGQAADQAGQAGHGGGHGREVGVQVGDTVLAGQAGHGDGLLGVVHGGADELPEVLADPAGELHIVHGCAPGLPQAAGARCAADVDHGGLHAGQLGVEAGIDRRAQGEDHDLLPGGLAGQDLRDDEGLREARVHLQHVPDDRGRHPVLRGGHGSGLRRHGRSPRGRCGRRSSAGGRPGGAPPRGRRGRCRCGRCGWSPSAPTRR